MSFLNSILNIGRQIEHGVEQVEHTVSNAVKTVESVIEHPQTLIKPSTGGAINDFGASFLRQQLLSQVGGTAAVAATAPTTKSSGGFFSQLGQFFSDAAGKLASTVVSGLASVIPAPIIKAGIGIASAYFGGEGGKGLDKDLASHLQAAGIDPLAISSARVFYNSPNAIPGYATTLGTDIHFGSKPDPKYWEAADELQKLINTGASPEAIHQAQNRLRESISDFALIAHETNHVSQYKREGDVGFASKYAGDFAGGFVNRVLNDVFSGNFNKSKVFDLNDSNAPFGGAYRGVGFEQQSYALQRNIVSKLESQYSSLLTYERSTKEVAADSAKYTALAMRCNCPSCS